MRLFALVSLVMVAFAANSILNRLGVGDGAMSPLAFALVRLASGALALCIFVWLSRGGLPLLDRRRWTGALSLTVYMLGFSLAYLVLDAGVGALILFAAVQLTIFAAVLIAREPLPAHRWHGALIAFLGLVVLLWPGRTNPPQAGALLMVAAGVGWGIYTLSGRKEADALGATAGNFVWASLLVGAVMLAFGGPVAISTPGLVYAVISGVATSAAGYALWYRVLPRLEASVAGVAQLTVPVLAVLGGIVFLGEALNWRFIVASGLVLGGVGWSLRR